MRGVVLALATTVGAFHGSTPASNHSVTPAVQTQATEKAVFYAHVDNAPLAPPVAPSPMSILPASSRAGFICIMWDESRSTPSHLNPNDLNVNSGAGGIFQFLPWIWQAGANELGITTQFANEASVTEQFEVASWYYVRNSGFYPEWSGDNC